MSTPVTPSSSVTHCNTNRQWRTQVGGLWRSKTTTSIFGQQPCAKWMGRQKSVKTFRGAIAGKPREVYSSGAGRPALELPTIVERLALPQPLTRLSKLDHSKESCEATVSD